MAHTFNSDTEEAEAGRFLFWRPAGLQSKFHGSQSWNLVSKKEKKIKK